MICGKCGGEVSQELKFCPNCGNALSSEEQTVAQKGKTKTWMLPVIIGVIMGICVIGVAVMTLTSETSAL